MNYALIWIDLLVVSLLWVAAGAACTGRLRRAWVRNAFLPLVLGVPLFFLGLFACGATLMKFTTVIEPNWFGYALPLFGVFLVGAFLILRAARRCEPGMAPGAARWGRGPLAVGWFLAVAVGYMTLWNMDLAIRARSSIESVEVNSLYLETLPAIVSDSQNAAPLYEKALADLKVDAGSDIHNPPLGDNSEFDPKEPATVAFLSRHAATIALLRRAASMPGCRFDADLVDMNLATAVAGLNIERFAANALDLDSREAMARGDTASAIRDAAAILGMSRHFGQRPLLIHSLVGLAIAALGNSTLERALPAVRNRDELAGLHLDELMPVGRMFQQGLRGEEVYGLTMYGGKSPIVPDAMSASWRDSSPEGRALAVSYATGPAGIFFRVFFFDEDTYIAMSQEMQNWATLPYYTIQNRVSEAEGMKHGMIPSLISVGMLRAFVACGRIAAEDSCAKAAVAMTCYRLDHGSMPSRLDDLVPTYLDAVPADPFDDKPIRLAVKADRWIIYSIGPDGVDDGGTEMAWDKDGVLKGDEIFTLRPAGADTATKP